MTAERWDAMSQWQRRRHRYAKWFRDRGWQARDTIVASRPFGAFTKWTGRTIVHAMGDSHTRVFRRVGRRSGLPTVVTEVVAIEAATAYGLPNPDSETRAGPRLVEALAEVPAGRTVVFSLGEVDCGYLCWSMNARRGDPVHEVLERSLARYEQFLEEHADHVDVILMAPPHPTVEDLSTGALRRRRELSVPVDERRELTRWFNRRLADVAGRQGWRVLDTSAGALDPDTHAVRPELVQPDGDHHYEWDAHARLVSDELRAIGF